MQANSQTAAAFSKEKRVLFYLLLAFGAVMAILVLTHFHRVNGPEYWNWTWRRLESWRFFPGMLLAVTPFFLGQYLHTYRRMRLVPALALVMLSTFALELTAVGMVKRPFDLSPISGIVTSPADTSYYNDAETFMSVSGVSLREWLHGFPQVLPQLTLHSKYHPPGPILFYAIFISLFGPGSKAALLGGLTVGLLAAAAVGATYWLLLQLCEDRETAFHGASFFALCPSLVLFFPEFDQAYALLAALMIGCWGMALRSRNSVWSVACAAVIAVGAFFSYVFFALGPFLISYSLLHIFRYRGPGLRRVAFYASIGAATLLGIYLVFWIIGRFDPIATFRTISTLQFENQRVLNRPYPIHLLYDILDFALGTGWISFVLIAYYLAASPRNVIAWLCVGEIMVMTILGLLPGESARLWLFLQPLLMVPVGLQMSRFTSGQRTAVYCCLWIITAAIGQNMTFIS
jgi:hypothetical protein